MGKFEFDNVTVLYDEEYWNGEEMRRKRRRKKNFDCMVYILFMIFLFMIYAIYIVFETPYTWHISLIFFFFIFLMYFGETKIDEKIKKLIYGEDYGFESMMNFFTNVRNLSAFWKNDELHFKYFDANGKEKKCKIKRFYD